jgi:riboflavin biosynthesis pyrimidine reductase
VRSEGYGPLRLHDADVSWRRARGLADHPVFAIVSASLALDPSGSLFAEAPVRPLVLTTDEAPRDARARLERVADVVACGADRVDPRLLVAALVDRGLPRIHSEGGPSLLADLVGADLVDEICVTTSPTLIGGAGPRIVAGSGPGEIHEMRLEHLLESDGVLLARYTRRR